MLCHVHHVTVLYIVYKLHYIVYYCASHDVTSWCASGWVRFMLPGWLASTCSASSAPCTISVGPWCAPMCPMRESSRPPNPTTSTWVCCSSSSFSVCYLLSIPSWPCRLHLTADPLGNNKQQYKNNKWLSYSYMLIYTYIVIFAVGSRKCLTLSWRRLTWTCQHSWGRSSATQPTQASSYQLYCSWCKCIGDTMAIMHTPF